MSNRKCEVDDITHRSKNHAIFQKCSKNVENILLKKVLGTGSNGTVFLAEAIIDGEKNTNSSRLLIGSRLGLPSDTFKGIIDEVRIYTSGLSESEVIELYNNLWF